MAQLVRRCTALLHTYHHAQGNGEAGFLAYAIDECGPYGALGTMLDSWQLVAMLAYLDSRYDLYLGIIETRSCFDWNCTDCANKTTRAKFYRKKVLMTTTTRLIRDIAADIVDHWDRPYFGAVPYINAMFDLGSIDDQYGADSARSIVAYFLSNAQTWRGPDARRIKAELNSMLKGKRS